MKEIIVILDDVRSALNVGAIFRTCDGSGVNKIILSGITPTPNHPKVKKTALGAEELIPYEHTNSTAETVLDLKEQGYTIIAIEQTAESEKFESFDFSGKIAVIFGNEITGVNPQVLELVDVSLELPMLGKKKSLNVATTAGIVLYNIRFIELRENAK